MEKKDIEIQFGAFDSELGGFEYTIPEGSKDSPVLSNSSNTGKSVWSEEDDDNMIMIEDRLSDYFDYIREDSTLSKNQKKSLKEEVIRYVNWLKSLKDRVQPQSQWKPSNEQIEALDFAVDCIVWEEFCIKRKVLKGLLEQLKKL